MAIVTVSGMDMCTNEGINVSLRILLELLRETAPYFSYRGLKLLGGYFISHMKNPPDNENSKTEMNRFLTTRGSSMSEASSTTRLFS